MFVGGVNMHEAQIYIKTLNRKKTEKIRGGVSQLGESLPPLVKICKNITVESRSGRGREGGLGVLGTIRK